MTISKLCCQLIMINTITDVAMVIDVTIVTRSTMVTAVQQQVIAHVFTSLPVNNCYKHYHTNNKKKKTIVFECSVRPYSNVFWNSNSSQYRT